MRLNFGKPEISCAAIYPQSNCTFKIVCNISINLLKLFRVEKQLVLKKLFYSIETLNVIKLIEKDFNDHINRSCVDVMSHTLGMLIKVFQVQRK